MNVPRDQSGGGRAKGAPDLGEVYLEYQRIGNLVKVSAIHAATAIEVSIQGPSSASPNELETLAINKLKYVMAKKSR